MARWLGWIPAARSRWWLAPGALVLYLALLPAVRQVGHLDGLLLITAASAAISWPYKAGLLTAVMTAVLRWVAAMVVGQPYTAADLIAHLLALVAVAALVGRLAQRERELAARTHELVRAQEQLAAIHEVAAAVGSTLDFHDALQVCHQRCKELFGMEQLAIMWRDPESGDLILEWAEGFSTPTGTRLRRGEGISGWVAEHDQPVIVGDVLSDPRYIPGLSGARSQASVPMRVQGQVVGVLTVESTKPNAFSAADLRLLASIADHLGAALANARLHQQVREMAITDAATNLYNHRHFQDVLRAALYERGHDPVALILFDLDHFKQVNDTYGHPAGDAILKQVAELLRISCRTRDVICRYGGEEFAVVLPNADREAATLVAERMREVVAQRIMRLPHGTDLGWTLTLSAGVAVCPGDADSPVELLVQADRALYAAKTAGRNRVAYPPPGPGALAVSD